MTRCTPLPWKQGMNSDLVIDDQGNIICQAWTIGTDEDVSANAAYIVQACNAFPDLVKALEELLRMSERHIFSDECLKERDAARAALAKAKGEA